MGFEVQERKHNLHASGFKHHGSKSSVESVGEKGGGDSQAEEILRLWNP
jgi:hypothetical protein